MQHIVSCHGRSSPGRKHPRIWPIAATTATEERVRAVPKGMVSPAGDPGAIHVLEHALCESGCRRAYDR